MNILVVCHGNVCRSPYLEAVLKLALPTKQISSAGFVGPGRKVPDIALELSAQRRIDLEQFRSRLIGSDNVPLAELVIVMDEGQAKKISAHFRIPVERIVVAGDLDPKPLAVRAIRDPWNQPREVFDSTFDRLDRCAATLGRIFAD